MRATGDPSAQSTTLIHRQMMLRAIMLARRGQGRVEPNPMVGCVIVKRGRIIGEGYHRRFGGPHAEVEALRSCTKSPKGASVYVSLEPCSHFGKTPSCTLALIEAGVASVRFAVADPTLGVGAGAGAGAGGGADLLRKAGIRVSRGPGEREAAEVLAPFLTLRVANRPYVIAKWAQSLDGKLATPAGESKWISCEVSRRRVHQLRARVDAILIGSATALTDDPLLTARGVPLKRRGLRVVLDGRLRIKPKSQLVATARDIATLVITCRKQAKSTKAKRLLRQGVEIVAVRSRRGRLLPAGCLEVLTLREITNLLVEGGPTILTSFFEAGLVDEAQVYVAPRLIGGISAPGPLVAAGHAIVDGAIKPLIISSRLSGTDTLYSMRLTEPPV